jgi:plasmid maintenance system antidote protein VapI
VFINLQIELLSKRKTSADLAEALGITLNALNYKLKGKGKFTLNEAFAIKNYLGSTKPLDELFAIEDSTA